MPNEAQNLLSRVAAAYLACRSYRDEGVVTTTMFPKGERPYVQSRPFSTRMVRPRGFLFEFRDRRERYVVWKQSGQARSWWSIKRNTNEGLIPLSRALAGATGVSGGSANRVPALLMPTLVESRWEEHSKTASIVSDLEASAVNCTVVEWTLPLLGVERLWIDRSTHLIQRVVEPRHLLTPVRALDRKTFSLIDPEIARAAEAALQSVARNPPEVEAVTTYHSQVGIDIDPAEMVFRPPDLDGQEFA